MIWSAESKWLRFISYHTMKIRSGDILCEYIYYECSAEARPPAASNEHLFWKGHYYNNRLRKVRVVKTRGLNRFD